MVNISKLESQNIYSSDKILNNDENKKQEKKKISEKKITNLYLVHWLTAYELWKEKPIFGWGTKSFRYKCNDLEDITYFVEEGRCNTHPHNIYLEILSETGIVGLLMISLFLIYNLKNIKIELINAYRISYNKEILILLLSLTFIFLSLIWPLKTSGRLFSNFYGTIFWFNIFCLINLLKNIKKFKNEK